MVSITQVERGLGRWVDNEVISKMPSGGQYDMAKKIAVSASSVYIIRKGMTVLTSLRGGLLGTLGLIDGNGNVDIDGVREAVAEKMPDEGIKVTIPILNEVTFYKADIDSMYRYIVGG